MCEGRDEKESLTEEMMNTCGYTVRGITNRKAVETLHMTLTSSKVEFEFSFTEPYGGCFEGSIPKGSYVL